MCHLNFLVVGGGGGGKSFGKEGRIRRNLLKKVSHHLFFIIGKASKTLSGMYTFELVQ